jgi:hypothetical protein
MSYRDPVKHKEIMKEYREKNKEKAKEYREQNKEKIKEQKKEYHANNKEQINEASLKRLEDRKQHAYDSITSNEIIDQYQWDMWCKEIKRRAKNKKHPYSDDFTNDIMFELMSRGCFYCGDIATTIDRIDSKLEHTPDNCVGCCHGCNMSKGTADPSTFIRKACYRICGEYVDKDTNIWFVYRNKPRLDIYITRAKKKEVPYELSKEDFNTLIKGDCKYCKRAPSPYFGIDRIVPSKGYVIGNVVPCCWDCNVDKHKFDIDTMRARNERIAIRVDDGIV